MVKKKKKKPMKVGQTRITFRKVNGVRKKVRVKKVRAKPPKYKVTLVKRKKRR